MYVRKQLLRLFVDLILLRSCFAFASDSETSTDITITTDITAGSFTELTNNGTTSISSEKWASTSLETSSALYTVNLSTNNDITYNSTPNYTAILSTASESIEYEQQSYKSTTVKSEYFTNAATAVVSNTFVEATFEISTDGDTGQPSLESSVTNVFEKYTTFGISENATMAPAMVSNLTSLFSLSNTPTDLTTLTSFSVSIESVTVAPTVISNLTSSLSLNTTPTALITTMSTGLLATAAPFYSSAVSTVSSIAPSNSINRSLETSVLVSASRSAADTTIDHISSAALSPLSTRSATNATEALRATTKMPIISADATSLSTGVSSMRPLSAAAESVNSVSSISGTSGTATSAFTSISIVPTTIYEHFTHRAESGDYSLYMSSTDLETSLMWTEETQSTLDFSSSWHSFEDDWWQKYDDMHSDYSYGSTTVDSSSETTPVDSTDDSNDSSVPVNEQLSQPSGWSSGDIESRTLKDDFIEYRNSSEDEATVDHDMHLGNVGSTASFGPHSKANKEDELHSTLLQLRTAPVPSSTNRIISSTNRITVTPSVFQNFAGSLALMATYTKDLSNASSAAFRIYATVVCDAVRKPSDSLVQIRSCVVHSIRQGSVIVDFTVAVELTNASANSSINMTTAVQNLIVIRVAQAAPTSWNVSAASLTLTFVAAPSSSAAPTVSRQAVTTGIPATTRLLASTTSASKSTTTTSAFVSQAIDDVLFTESMSMPFTPAASEPPAQRLGDIDSTVAWWVWLVVAVGVLVIGTVGACVYSRKRRQHQAVPTPPTASTAEKGAAGEGAGPALAKAKQDPESLVASAPTTAGAPISLPQMHVDKEHSETPRHEDKEQQQKKLEQQQQPQQQQQPEQKQQPEQQQQYKSQSSALNSALTSGPLKPVPVIEIKAPDDSPVVNEEIKSNSVSESGDASSSASTRTAVPQPDVQPPAMTQAAGTSSVLPPTELADNNEQFDDASDVFTQPSLKALDTTANEKATKASASEVQSSSTESLKKTDVEAGERGALAADCTALSHSSGADILESKKVPSSSSTETPAGGHAGSTETKTKEISPKLDADNDNEKYEDA